jgi:hypothetical protein
MGNHGASRDGRHSPQVVHARSAKMNITSFHAYRHTLRRFTPLLAAAGFVLASSSAIAGDKPSADEIAQARGICLAQEHQMQLLEAKSKGCHDSPELVQLRERAEKSCAHAELLMVAAGMEQPAAQPQPALPTPTLVIAGPVNVAQTEPADASFASLTTAPCN